MLTISNPQNIFYSEYSKSTSSTKPTIPHLKTLVVDNIFLGGHGHVHSCLKRLPKPFLLKSTLFTNRGHSKHLKMPHPSLSGILSGLSNELSFVFVLSLVLIQFEENRNWCLKCVIAINRPCIYFSAWKGDSDVKCTRGGPSTFRYDVNNIRSAPSSSKDECALSCAFSERLFCKLNHYTLPQTGWIQGRGL